MADKLLSPHFDAKSPARLAVAMSQMEITADMAPNMPQEVVDAAKLPAVETESAIYFFGMARQQYDCFNQWYPSHFHDPALEGAHFRTAEHYMSVV